MPSLALLPPQHDPNFLVDISTADDTGVYKVTEEIALVQTVDFFTPPAKWKPERARSRWYRDTAPRLLPQPGLLVAAVPVVASGALLRLVSQPGDSLQQVKAIDNADQPPHVIDHWQD